MRRTDLWINYSGATVISRGKHVYNNKHVYYPFDVLSIFTLIQQPRTMRSLGQLINLSATRKLDKARYLSVKLCIDICKVGSMIGRDALPFRFLAVGAVNKCIIRLLLDAGKLAKTARSISFAPEIISRPRSASRIREASAKSGREKTGFRK